MRRTPATESAAQELPCPACGQANGAGARFCSSCGNRLVAAPAAPPERRLVSVMFADLEDFTGLVERLDPEASRDLQTAYFAIARRIVEGYGGTLEKFIGDAVMAVWGAPLAREGDAERSVRAALDLVAAVDAMASPVGGVELHARAAVASGEAAVSAASERQGMLAGDPVNTAARLQALAPSGGVLVDATTRRLTARAFRFAEAGPVQLKGKQQPVAAWRAVRALAASPGGTGSSHAGQFVGRQFELATLLAAYERACATGSRLALVVGGPGIGKGRLRHEFELELRLRGPATPLILAAGASTRAPTRPLAPLAEIVRRWAGIRERDSMAAARRRLTRALAGLDGPAAPAGEGSKHGATGAADDEALLPSLLGLLDPAAAAKLSQEQLHAAWRGLIERIAAERPTVLVFEDLQWADAGVLDFIEHLVGWARSPVLVLGLARPEVLDRRPGWAESTNVELLRLGPLDDSAMRQLLGGLAADLPPTTARQVLDRAGGVPLYAVELLRLRDEGVAIDETQLPDSLRALVAARIDVLPAAERRLLHRAAVLGRRFPRARLAVLANGDPPAMDDSLAGLVRRQLLTDEHDRAAGEAEQLAFVEDVVRDVAYRTLSRAQRRDLHFAVAEHLAAGHPGLVEELADHLFRCHAAAPDHPAAAQVAARALPILRQAAARANALFVPARALRHLDRALELPLDQPTRLEVLADAAAAARSAARFDRAEQLLNELIHGHAGRGDRAGAARARAQLANLLLATERHGPALSELEAALSELSVALGGTGSELWDAPTAELAGQLARAKMLVGELAESVVWAEQSIAAASRLRAPTIRLDALITRGTVRLRLGDVAAGTDDLRAAIDGAADHGIGRLELRARNNLAWLGVLEDPHGSLLAAHGGRDLALRLGLGDMALQLAQVEALVAIDTGDWDEALAVIDSLRDHPQADAHRIQLAAIEATIGGLRGDPQARRSIRSLGRLPADTDRQMLAAIDLARAWIRFAGADFAAAGRAARRAARDLLSVDHLVATTLALRSDLWLGKGGRVARGLAWLDAKKRHGWVARATETTLHAGVAALAGAADAGQRYERAIAEWRDLRLPLHLGLALAERHRLLGGPRDEAQQIFEQLRAPSLARLLDLPRASG
ncbi:adenylate/guanylate cyclase domain-containing protein [soil metagenome]